MKRFFITVTGTHLAIGSDGKQRMVNGDINWRERVHLCLRSRRRGVRNMHLLTGTLDEAVHAALARAVEERERLIIKYEFTSRRLTWNGIVELSNRPDLPMSI